jgi:non-heme chloroperoxidase
MTLLSRPEATKAPLAPPTSRRITVAGGVALDYAERGDPSGPPVILLHGYTDSRRSYEPLMAAMQAGLRLLAVSHRGHGDSDKPDSRYDADELIGDIRSFMDALGIAQAVVVGHSMSSQIAQNFAARHPDRTEALVLLGAFTTLRGNAEVEGLLKAVAALTDPVDPAFVHEFQSSTLARPVPTAFFETVVAESLKVPAHVWRSAAGAQFLEDSSACHAAISAPTLVLWGTRDVIGPRHQQERMIAGIGDARLGVYDGLGHSPHWETPHRVAADIAAFLDARSRSRTRPMGAAFVQRVTGRREPRTG